MSAADFFGFSVPTINRDSRDKALDKRSKLTPVKDKSITLDSYVVGYNWKFVNTTADRMFVIGDTLYRVRLVDFYGDIIEASQDYGATWSYHSRLPYGLHDGHFVNTSGSIVYLVGGTRDDSDRDDSSSASMSEDAKCPVPEIWVSEDGMKTFHLVTEFAEFKGRPVTRASAGPDCSLYVQCSRSDSERRDNWVSNDGGQSWRRLDESEARPRHLRNCIATLGKMTYSMREGIRHNYNLFVADLSGDEEICEPVITIGSFIDKPLALVADNLRNRLICFCKTQTFEMAPGEKSWTMVGNYWLTATRAAPLTSRIDWQIEEVFTFPNGAILLEVMSHHPVMEKAYVVSHPETVLATKHKGILRNFMQQFGIHEALFNAKIVPLLFPY